MSGPLPGEELFNIKELGSRLLGPDGQPLQKQSPKAQLNIPVYRRLKKGTVVNMRIDGHPCKYKVTAVRENGKTTIVPIR